MLEVLKNLFTSKKKKLILDIKKKHNKGITDGDINDYRRTHNMCPDSISDNGILGLILLDDIEVKSTQLRNIEKVETITYSEYYTPNSSSSSRSSRSSRNDDDLNYNSSSYSSHSNNDSSSSSDCGSSSSCD